MADGNNKPEEERTKKCPLLGEWCIKDECALYAEMVRNVAGLQRKGGTCAINAMVVILSEINIKAHPPQQQVKLPPNLHIGRG